MTYIQDQYSSIAADFFANQQRDRATEQMNRETAGLGRLLGELNITTEELAHAVAQRSALDIFIKTIVGSDFHNLRIISDVGYRNKIGEAGRSAWNATKSWDAVKLAGRTFSMDPPPDLFKNYVGRALHDQLQNKFQHAIQENKEILELNLRLSKKLNEVVQICNETTVLSNNRLDIIENLQSQVVALKSDQAKLIKAAAQHMAQSAAFRQQLREVEPSNPLLVDSYLRQRVADVAYEQLVASGFDWSVVKEVATTFVTNEERTRAVGRENTNNS